MHNTVAYMGHSEDDAVHKIPQNALAESAENFSVGLN